MSQKVNTLIIGGGFAGSSVAHALKDSDYLILDRGEAPSYELFQGRYDNFKKDNPPNPYDRWWQYYKATDEVYRSDLPFNPKVEVAKKCHSHVFHVGDGLSNAWGGICLRLPEEVFETPQGQFRWPFSLNELKPYYARAEHFLNVAGEASMQGKHSFTGEIKGVEYWRQLFKPHFPKAYATPIARHTGESDHTEQGICCGANQCDICPSDAKARPQTIFADRQIKYGVKVEKILFDGNKAVGVECQTLDGTKKILCERLVVAAHGVSSCDLLLKSDLPTAVKREYIGRHYNDHSVLHMLIKMPEKIRYNSLNGRAYMVLPEISGMYDDIHVHAAVRTYTPPEYMIMKGMDLEKLNRQDVDGFLSELGHFLAMSVYFEVPSELDMHLVSASGGGLTLNDKSYQSLVPKLKKIHKEIVHKLEKAGIEHRYDWAEYEYQYGDDHIGGTLNMTPGKYGVVAKDFKLIGTDNVYVSGGALFPRPGGQNPTLTVAALGLKLGEQLAKSA